MSVADIDILKWIVVECPVCKRELEVERIDWSERIYRCSVHGVHSVPRKRL